MFREWGFLLGEIWVLLALATLVGVIAGWLFWGRRSAGTVDTSEADRLRADLDTCGKAMRAQDARIATLEADLATCQGEASDAKDTAEAVDYDGDGVIEGKDEGTRPQALSGPRDGQADDLKRIKGIGPKMEQLCNNLGFYHFDQIAGWSAKEVAWVDANLEGFKGRVSRDNWVEQAKLLAEGGETAFSRKVDNGDVY